MMVEHISKPKVLEGKNLIIWPFLEKTPSIDLN